MTGENRTDRILIGIALAILLLAGGAFYFDGWMWGNRRTSGDRIGLIDAKSGDVRMKFEGDLKWNRAARGQDLNYNDSIFAGQGSQAELKLGDTKMTVTENTLIVLRRDKDVNFLNLNYGTLLGKVAKNEKVVIETGVGKPIELTTSSNAQIVVRKSNGKTQLDVVAGEAKVKVDGKEKKLTKDSRIVMDDKAPSTKVEQIKLLAKNPLKDEILYSEQPLEIPFKWGWSSGRSAQANDKFTLEFAVEPSFQKLHANKVVSGSMETTMNVSRTLSLYYRVRGPLGETSQVEKVNFVRLNKPVIVRPVAEQQIITPPGQNALIEMEFQRPESTQVWYQLSSDPEFKQIVSEASVGETRKVQELAIGNYYLRARSDYGNRHLSAWTETVPFKVEPQLEMLKLSDLPAKNKIVIPNRAYPETLYRADSGKVRRFLKNRGFLNDYFPFAKGTFEQLKVQFDGQSEPVAQTGSNWPEKAMEPGKYGYKYQVSKLGFKDSPVSERKEIEIAMEPPRPVGQPVYGAPNEKSEREVGVMFTPLLFAKSYDVEYSKDPRFGMVRKSNVVEPAAKLQIAQGTYYWRARARNKDGKVISDYSKPAALNAAEAPTLPLAQTEPKPERKIAAVEKTSTSIEKVQQERWERSGWWGWLGSGYNFVQIGQSNSGRAQLEAKNARSGSQYVEAGYVGSSGYGGVFSYKGTPGKAQFTDGEIDRETFNWTTMSIEGFMKRLSSFRLFNSPISYGIRAGVQRHSVPFIFVDADTLLQMKTNEMTTGSVGMMADWMRNRWTYSWMMRYQIPFQSRAEGSSVFSITPQFAFDGSVGTSYNFTQQLKAGVFWYGQWHQYNFVYGDADVTNTGFQSLFYSNIDLRLGFDF